jgi:uncharacterized protein YecE (DUF72 family)
MTDEFLKTGCCGFPVPKEEYAARFPTGEVQQTFYQPPRLATLQRWRALVPKEFEFTLKAWQLITHTAKSPTFRRLKIKLAPGELAQCGSFQFTPPVLRAWETSWRCAEALQARRILFQCPASFLPSLQNLRQTRHFFSSIDRHGLTLIWEPRGDWNPVLIRSLCEELDLIQAVDPLVSQSVTPHFIYFRLHGGKGFKHVYSTEELHFVREQIRSGVPAYVLFNNIQMWQDATRFAALEEAQENYRRDDLK